ncbi:SRPBCC family protein [Deinococcus sp. Leaf326]|uniref:SRPBCC family protein n=1 Tax=Deinococcus sp. Leaf326 TaxID=1736338 RepID=UPI0006F83918|nr:SRPBCC family protein [Deinococcus sp. Leaf326]KQR04716.1 cyclase [Deinococcus sp. Leaf326]
MTKEESKGMDQQRLIGGAAGGALVLMGLRKRGVLGLGIAAVGGYLAYRAATGNDPVMKAAGLGSGPASSKPIFVEHSVVIERPPQQVYDFWRKLDNLPQIMSHLEEVTQLDAKRSRWVAKAPLGTHVEWEAEIVNDKPGERIGWHSLPGATVDNAGSVQFEGMPGGNSTRVHVALSYRPPAGPLGAAVAKLFGEEPSQQIAEDLQKFKQSFEGTAPKA